MAPQRTESGVALASRFIAIWEADRTHAPEGRHADTTGTFHRQQVLLKAADAELASRLWDLPAERPHFALLARLLAARLGCG
jgi:hypothetical protein